MIARFVGALILPLFLIGCSYPIVKDGKVLQDRTLKIQQETEMVRGLEFLSPVTIKYSRKEQTKKLLRQMIERDLTPEEMTNLQKALFAFGLIRKPDFKIQEVIDLYADQAAGFYDPITKSLYLTDALNKKGLFLSLFEFILQRDLTGELLLSHELTHALQDQHFGLEAYILEGKENLDLLLARHSVIEGDATATCINVTLADFGQSIEETADLPDRIQREAKKFGSGLENLPPILREHLIFPYYGGLYFCRQVLLAKGWKGLDELYTDPPQSTEQILHPEKYLKVRDDPKPLSKPTFSFLEKEYSFVLENTFGELGTYILISAISPKKKAKLASEGWGNDRFWVWESKDKPNEFAKIWLTKWDSPLDAKEFFNELSKKIKNLPEEKFTSRSSDMHSAEASTPAGKWLKVLKDEDQVFIVEGFSKEETKRIIKQF